MAAADPGERRDREGRELIEALQQSGVNIIAAFWAFQPDMSEWRLFLVTPALNTQGPRRLLRQAGEVLRRLNGSASFDLYDVEFESPSNPALMQLASHFGDIKFVDTKLTGVDVGGIQFNDLHVYFMETKTITEGDTQDAIGYEGNQRE